MHEMKDDKVNVIRGKISRCKSASNIHRSFAIGSNTPFLKKNSLPPLTFRFQCIKIKSKPIKIERGLQMKRRTFFKENHILFLKKPGFSSADSREFLPINNNVQENFISAEVTFSGNFTWQAPGDIIFCKEAIKEVYHANGKGTWNQKNKKENSKAHALH